MKVSVVTVFALLCAAHLAYSSDTESSSSPAKLELWNIKCLKDKDAPGCGGLYANPYPDFGPLCNGKRSCERCQLSTLAVLKKLMERVDTSQPSEVIGVLQNLVTGETKLPAALTSKFSRNYFCAAEMGEHSKTWFPLLVPGTTVKFCKRVASFFGSGKDESRVPVRTVNAENEQGPDEKVLPRQILGTLGQFYYGLFEDPDVRVMLSSKETPFGHYHDDETRTVDTEMNHGGLPEELLAFARDLCSCSEGCGCGEGTCGFQKIQGSGTTSEAPTPTSGEANGLRGATQGAEVDDQSPSIKAPDQEGVESMRDIEEASASLNGARESSVRDDDAGEDAGDADDGAKTDDDDGSTMKTREKTVDEIIAKLKLNGVIAMGIHHLDEGVYNKKVDVAFPKSGSEETTENDGAEHDATENPNYADAEDSKRIAEKEVIKELSALSKKPSEPSVKSEEDAGTKDDTNDVLSTESVHQAEVDARKEFAAGEGSESPVSKSG